MKVEIVYASETKQCVQEVDLSEGATIQKAIESSSLLDEFPEINLNETAVGIFGKKCSLSTMVRSADRIEIYRPLTIHPMQKRRRLAEIQKKRGQSLPPKKLALTKES